MVINFQEANRAGRLASRGIYQGSLRAQPGEIKAVTAAGLLDQCSILERGKDAVGLFTHVIRYGQNEAGSQLA